MNKRLVAILLATAMTVGVLSGCSQEETKKTEEVAKEETQIEKEDLAELVTGIENHYILQDAKEVDFLYGIEYDEKVIEEVEVDDSQVKLNEPGKYKVVYTVSVNQEEYEASKATKTEEEKVEKEATIVKVEFETEIEVVDKDKAQELANEGKEVWGDKNETIPKEEIEEKEDSETAKEDEKQTDQKTESSNSSDKETQASTSNKNNNTSQNNSSSNNSKPSGGNSSGSSSGSSSNGGSTSKPSTPSAPAHTHNWQPRTETVVVEEAWTETIYEWGNICYACNEIIKNDLAVHSIECNSNYHYGKKATGTIDHPAKTEDRVVGSKCSCGAIK